MAKINMSGAEELMRMLDGLSHASDELCRRGVYSGAGVLADALAQAVDELPTETYHPTPGSKHGGEPLNVVTQDDKEDIRAGLGISRINNTADGADVAISFEGYSRHTEAKYPKGVPIPMIVRSIESGSSTRQKHPFIRRTVTKAKEDIYQAEADAVHEAQAAYQKTGRMPGFSAPEGKAGKGTHTKHT